MRKHCSNVCEFRPCLATESTNSAPMRTILTAALQWQYLQTELIFWITLVYIYIYRGTRWRRWLRHCATSWKAAGSIPDDVIDIFHWHNPSGRTMALGLTQSLTEMSTRNISWGVNAVGTYGWQTYHLHVLNVLKSGSLNLLEPTGPVRACNGIALLIYMLFVLVSTTKNGDSRKIIFC